MSKLHRANQALAERIAATRNRLDFTTILIGFVCLAPWAFAIFGVHAMSLLTQHVRRHGDIALFYRVFFLWLFGGPYVLATIYFIRHRNDPRPRRHEHGQTTFSSGKRYDHGHGSIGSSNPAIGGTSHGGFSAGGGSFGGGGATGGW